MQVCEGQVYPFSSAGQSTLGLSVATIGPGCLLRLRGTVVTVSSTGHDPTHWTILGERLVDENPFIRLIKPLTGRRCG